MISRQAQRIFYLWSVATLFCASPVVAAVGTSSTPSAATPVDLAVAEQLYNRKCGACHSIDANRIGPQHRDVIGRKAGSITGFAYSDALKKSGIIWTKATLDKWLQGPTKLVPGTRMAQTVPDMTERQAIIGWLVAHSAAGDAASSTESTKPKPSRKRHNPHSS